ncbi:MAG: type II toxin-antitoxin system HigB family toxin [Cyclobacteriaceae bacterium]|jgi:mRNA interferase HigB|nr:type II toxin-antitoxin system HigB family toxin [Cyclobacteriaceae bacterium]
MRVIAKRTIRQFWEKHPTSENALKSWYQAVVKAEWKNFQDLKGTFRATDYVGNERYVFDIKGNMIRIVAKIDFEFQWLFVRFIGTRADYDKMNKKIGAESV